MGGREGEGEERREERVREQRRRINEKMRRVEKGGEKMSNLHT